MTEKSEAEDLDLNSVVVLSELTNEINGANNQAGAVIMEVDTLNGETNEVRDGGVSKKSLESEVNDAENEKMEDLSSKKDEGTDCGGNVGVSLDEAIGASEAEKEKEKEKAFDDEVERNEDVKKGASVVDLPSSNVDENSSVYECVEAADSVSDVVKPQSPGTTESAGHLIEDTVVGMEKKAELLPQIDSGKELPDVVQKEELNFEVHLEAQSKEDMTKASKSSENESKSSNIVNDLSPLVYSRGNVKSEAAFKPEFAVGDLVWGKVRSHPWWPGQICDPSAASRKAKKHSKRDGYLIAYYGDYTFAWNDVSRMKPFLTHFSQMEKLSSTEDFHDALDCILEEVSRRVEFGLACSCIPEEVYANLKTQIIINAGLEEDKCRVDGGDRLLTVDSFEPIKLVEYVKELAQVPCGVTEKLELTIARSRLLAFNRSKGYSQLPEFNMLGGLLENDADILLSGGTQHCSEVIGAVDLQQKGDNVDASISDKEKPKSQGESSLKRKQVYGNSAVPSKKEKIVKDFADEKHLTTPVRKSGLESKLSSKKRKVGEVMSEDLAVNNKKIMASVDDNNSPQLPKPTFRVGESIRRVASQLNGSSPILKSGDVICKSKANILPEESKPEKLETEECPDDKLSQLFLAARDPKRVNNSSMITFFSEFRSTVSLGLPSSEIEALGLPSSEIEESLEKVFGSKTVKKLTKRGRKSNMPGFTELPSPEMMKESYWSDRIVRSIPEPEDRNEIEDLLAAKCREKKIDNSAIKPPQNPLEQQTDDENIEMEVEKSDSFIDDNYPTALILNFTNLDSVPTETNLNKIFSQYDSLKESETQIFKKSSRAKVVFGKRSDAETAFSSAGKYSTFGPSLVSYRLKYLKSTQQSKASPSPKKRSKKGTESVEEGANLIQQTQKVDED
ncbi:hypothetical protein F8388_007492 [Cannabis sativa]|uniref:PWWP domain-containing protein n=1 Tax=Cannabis sativa TaxID=3483 RepID=A0A7J6F724_CANSA|nr:hypothetical protein F8388_007492 [Cannabis sativa]